MDSNTTLKYQPDITKEELSIVASFQELLRSKKVSYDTMKFDTFYLARFLRARKHDLKKTFEMFVSFLKWRKDNNVEDVENFEFPELEKIKIFYPHVYHKTSKAGNPVYIELLGDLKLEELFKLTTTDRLLTYQIKEYEHLLKIILPACCESSGKFVHQIVSIIDLKKLSSKFLSKKVYSFVKMSFHICQNYYPEILAALFIVNTGFIFKAGWAVCKAFVDEKTKKKITIIGSDYKKKLLEYIESENLPKILGGECKCEPYGCLYSKAGPWNKDGVVAINPEIAKTVQEALEKQTNEEPEGEGDIEQVKNDVDEDDEEREKLEELSNQLNDNMIISKGMQESAEYRLENDKEAVDIETPINTQENESAREKFP